MSISSRIDFADSTPPGSLVSNATRRHLKDLELTKVGHTLPPTPSKTPRFVVQHDRMTHTQLLEGTTQASTASSALET